MPIASTNPATGEVVKTFEPHTDAQVDERLAKAERAFRAGRREKLATRQERLRKAAGLFEQRREALARTAVLEMGKPLKQALAEVDKCATGLRWYADEGERLMADETIQSDASRSFIRYEPLGPVLAVMPWNFAYWQVVRFAAPALLAGNVGLLKHASSVPQVSLELEKTFLEAGFPEGSFQSLLIEAKRVERVVADRRIVAATLTGSEGAGRSLAAACGKHLKTTVLELGGSDPYLVMPSANLDKAAEVAVQARVQNNGQSCIAAKRFFVHEAVADRFEEAMATRMRALRVGDPMELTTELGPLAQAQVRDDVHDQVRRTLEQGARAVCGGEKPSGRGFYYPATLLTRVPDGAPAADEEVFGPVAALFRVKSLDEAIRRANDTRFGLGSSVWTTDRGEQERAASELEAGSVFINGMVKSDPRLPFGGVKASGYGRELAAFGLREFLNIKTVWIG